MFLSLTVRNAFYIAWRMLSWVNAWRRHDWFYIACLYFPSLRKHQNSLKDLRIRMGVSSSCAIVIKSLRFWIFCTPTVLANALLKGQVCINDVSILFIKKGHTRWIALSYIYWRPAINFFFNCSKLNKNIHIMKIYWLVGP